MVFVKMHSNSKFEFSSGPKIKIEDTAGKRKNTSNLNKPPRQKCVYLNMQLAALQAMTQPCLVTKQLCLQQGNASKNQSNVPCCFLKLLAVVFEC